MHANKLTTRPEHEVISAIQALDLESVKARLMDAELGEGWSHEYADSIEQAYKTYLTMLVRYQDHAEEIMLAKDVDEFWHTHILQTLKYSADCERVFGAYLHHNPHVGPRTSVDMARRGEQADATRRLYECEFGEGAGAQAAWAGGLSPTSGAWSSVAMRSENTAWSSAAIKSEHSAWSSAAIKADNTAWSSAAIKPENAAWSSAAIRAENAAWSSAAIRADNAAWSSAAIEPQNAAWSSAAVRSDTSVHESAGTSA